MQEDRNYTLHYLLRAGIMVGLSFYISHLVKSERLLYYIAPQMTIYVKIAAILLFLIAAYQVVLAFRSMGGFIAQACGCEHLPSRSTVMNVLIYTMFLCPLLLGFLLPDKVMGSDVASLKGMNLNASTVQKSPPSSAVAESNLPVAGPTAPAPAVVAVASTDKVSDSEDMKLKELFKSDKFTEVYAKLGMQLYKKDTIQVKEQGFMEILTAVDLYMDAFVGKKMEISGFVYREEGMPQNQFVVSRLAMSCCSADASPYGVLVESPIAKEFTKDTWVKLTGVIGKTTHDGNEIMKIDAKSIGKIKASDTPYVYPYTDEFDKLIN
ncbi:TIGR03943 family putative permease subunit [Paenibacillus cremeus]|uniref:TIGR03943 family protein n=1 Tax=Paenibacillus cremeus TaxID=2163881 RepID=A0A559K4D6_9BACL|nr:TIGR03943 family protein [Paenibacillus cremeus]TVY06943.1 TIGR03943 family protein [Paenibacillus cremeus]